MEVGTFCFGKLFRFEDLQFETKCIRSGSASLAKATPEYLEQVSKAALIFCMLLVWNKRRAEVDSHYDGMRAIHHWNGWFIEGIMATLSNSLWASTRLECRKGFVCSMKVADDACEAVRICVRRKK